MRKNLIAAAIAILGCAGMASAQCPDCPNAAGQENKMYQPQSFTDFAFEGILLSVDQQDAINAINAEMLSGCPEAAACDSAQVACDKAMPGKCGKGNHKGNKSHAKCDKADGKCDKAEGECCKADGQCDKVACDKAPGQCPEASATCDRAPRGQRPGMGHRPGMGQRPGMGAPRVCKDYVEKVKTVLTPEQYTTFLENILFMAPQQPQPAAGPRGQRCPSSQGCPMNGRAPRN